MHICTCARVHVCAAAVLRLCLLGGSDRPKEASHAQDVKPSDPGTSSSTVAGLSPRGQRSPAASCRAAGAARGCGLPAGPAPAGFCSTRPSTSRDTAAAAGRARPVRQFFLVCTACRQAAAQLQPPATRAASTWPRGRVNSRGCQLRVYQLWAAAARPTAHWRCAPPPGTQLAARAPSGPPGPRSARPERRPASAGRPPAPMPARGWPAAAPAAAGCHRNPGQPHPPAQPRLAGGGPAAAAPRRCAPAAPAVARPSSSSAKQSSNGGAQPWAQLTIRSGPRGRGSVLQIQLGFEVSDILCTK